MNNSSSARYTRNDRQRLFRQSRVSGGSLARFFAMAAALLLGLCFLASPCAASEEAEGSPESEAQAERESEVQADQEPNVEVDQEWEVEVARPPRRIWYGWQNLLVDGSGQTLAVLMAVAIGEQDGGASAIGTGLFSYVIGGPTVHFSHGNVGKGFGSLGLRVALPSVGALAGYAIDVSQCTPGYFTFCGLAGGFLGFVIGVVSAIAIDAGVLAYKKVAPEDTSNRSARLAGLSFVVLPSLSPDHAGLSVTGLF